MKGFTLLESIVVLFLFVVAILIASQTYVNLMRSAVLAQSYQLALDNFRFGTEKVWNEIKNGSNFRRMIGSSPVLCNGAQTDNIVFSDRRCREIRIYPTSTPQCPSGSKCNLAFQIDGRPHLLFDNELVLLESFRVYCDRIVSGPAYYQNANKIFILNYKVRLKTKTTQIPFEVWQAVAPSNSVFMNPPCQ
jgi:prepilin-type N-terminal cleavage/methylation domain-containing protein